MITYLVDGAQYTLSYSSLREDWLKFTMMSDDDFMENLVPILHFACIVCYLKEVPGYIALSDQGVVHELVHLLHYGSGFDAPDATFDLRLERIRDTFNRWCCLA